MAFVTPLVVEGVTLSQPIVRVGIAPALELVLVGIVVIPGGSVNVWVTPPDVTVVVTLGPVALFEEDPEELDCDEEPDADLDDEDPDEVALVVPLLKPLWLEELVTEPEADVL